MNEKYDVVVIGSGPGGYVCAIKAAQLGKKVAVVEAENLGGICLNWGCIPTKSLLRSAEVLHLMQNHKNFGLHAEKISANLSEIVARSRNVSSQLSGGVTGLLKKNKVTVIKGFASFLSNKKIKIDGEKQIEVEANNFVIATGARARVIAGFEPDGHNIITYKEAMTLDKLPKSIVVVGSGAIGIEFASFYNTLGVDVTVLEAQDRILPVEDKEISDFANKAYTKHGIKILTSVKLKELKKHKDFAEITYDVSGKIITQKTDKIIMAVGVTPNTDKLNLKNTSVKLDEKSLIKTNEFLKTDDPKIYAIGDVIEGPWLAHKASHEGVLVAEHIAGQKVKPIIKTRIAGCTYSMPQIASVGLTEDKAKSLGLKIKVGKFPFMANGKAIALGEQEGLIKLIFEEKTGEILGAHMCGAEVTELISNIVLAMQLEATEEDLMHTIFPHPTLSEMIHEAALNAYGKAVHI